MKPVLVIGAGWSGAAVAHRLVEAGMRVDVLERASVIGGHSRMETLCGVHYEPNGPHLLHTDNERVAVFLRRLGLGRRPYRFQPRTEVELADGELRIMSWPIQLDELEALPDWPTIRDELDALPSVPSGDDFESYAVSLMGRRLYELFIEGYTRKQWGRDPSTLSSSFAPKRIDLRRDGYRDLFRDRWQWFPPEGVNDAIESLLRGASVAVNAGLLLDDLVPGAWSAIVITAALDEFAATDGLEWRGVRLRSRYAATRRDETLTPAYVINRPSPSVPYTRTIETKHASGQWVDGTVVSEEYPGTDARHYPVDDVDGENRQANVALQQYVRDALSPTPVFFAGRLATYRYINQDEAILGAWDCAEELLRSADGNAGKESAP